MVDGILKGLNDGLLGKQSHDKLISLYSNEDVAHLSAKRSDANLTIDCNENGTLISSVGTGTTSATLISKGNLASVSYYSNRKEWALGVGIMCLTVGFLLYFDANDLRIAGVLAAVGLAFVAYFLLSKTSVLEFETAGGKRIFVSFSGSAARKQTELALFCGNASIIDRGMKVEPKYQIPQLNNENVPF